MTLAEIRAEMPKLQQSIALLEQRKNQFTMDLNDINEQLRSNEALTRDDEEIIARCERFLSENESSTVQEVVARVNRYKQEQADAKKAIQDREKTIEDLNNDRKAIEEDPVNQQITKEIGEARTKLDSIFETLEKDPIINAKLQEAIRYEFFTEIQAQKTEKVQYEGISSKLEASLKDGSRDGLKTLAELTAKRRATLHKSIYDDQIDIKKARSSFRKSTTDLTTEIKNKFGVEVKTQEDIDYILDFAEGKVTGEFKLPSAEAKLEKADKIIKKLEEKRDERLAELSGKVVPVAGPENTQEIEDNKKVIEELEKENTETILPAIATATQRIDEIEEKIDEKTKVTPEDKQALDAAEQDLKDNHIISEEVVTDLKDENSDLSKLFKDFVEADIALRKAFKKCEYDKTDDAKDRLDAAIMKYKGIAEQLAADSGYDIESWQNYNKALINDRILNGETVDSIYTYPERRNFYKLADDKNVKKNDDAVAAYDDAFDKLDMIDEQESNILDGDFSGVSDLKKSLEEYHDSMGALQGHAGPALDVYGVVRGNAITKVSMWTKLGNFFTKHFKDKILFDVPKKKDLVDAYLSKKPGANLSDEEKEEIESLREEKDSLTAERTVLESKRDENLRNISGLEAKNADLASRDAARTSSELGTQEELSFVTREGIEAKGYVEGKSVREDIKKVIDDEGR